MSSSDETSANTENGSTSGEDSLEARGRNSQFSLSLERRRLQKPLLGLALIALGFATWYGWQRRIEWMLMFGQTPPSLKQRTNPPTPSANFNLETTSIPAEKILPGGPAKDGIPSLTDPKFIPASGADFLDGQDRVIGVRINGHARAYPLKILQFHEAVNDTLAEKPIAVTYCPLCDSAAVFDRRRSDGPIEVGISGLLYNSNVLLYDRREQDASESLWSQMMAEAVAGPRTGEPLTPLPLELTTWADWSARHPETEVLSTKTGFLRDYSSQAYARYHSSSGLMFPVETSDDRLPEKARVLGVWTSTAAKAYPLRAFQEFQDEGQVPQKVGSHRLTISYDPEARSLRVLHTEEGVHWMYAYWFAWSAFHPETEVFEPSGQ